MNMVANNPPLRITQCFEKYEAPCRIVRIDYVRLPMLRTMMATTIVANPRLLSRKNRALTPRHSPDAMPRNEEITTIVPWKVGQPIAAPNFPIPLAPHP